MRTSIVFQWPLRVPFRGPGGIGMPVSGRCSWTMKECRVRVALNSLAPGRFQTKFRLVIFKLALVNGGWGISYENALRWMPLDLTDEKSTLVQVMAWCRQATIQCLSQCWPRSLSPYGVTRPQWVNMTEVEPGRKIHYTGCAWHQHRYRCE